MHNNYQNQLVNVIDKIQYLNANKFIKSHTQPIQNRSISPIYTQFIQNNQQQLCSHNPKQPPQKPQTSQKYNQTSRQKYTTSNLLPSQSLQSPIIHSINYPTHLANPPHTLHKTQNSHPPNNSTSQQNPQQIIKTTRNNKYFQMLKLGQNARKKSNYQKISQQNLKMQKRISNVKSTLANYNHKFQKYRYTHDNTNISNDYHFSQNLNTNHTKTSQQNIQLNYNNNKKDKNNSIKCNQAKIKKDNKLIIKTPLTIIPTIHRKMKSSSEVNRCRQQKRIQLENSQLKSRLMAAMSKSKYSQMLKINFKHQHTSKNSHCYQKQLKTNQKQLYFSINNFSNNFLIQNSKQKQNPQQQNTKQHQNKLTKNEKIQTPQKQIKQQQQINPSQQKSKSKSKSKQNTKTISIRDKLQQSIQVFLQKQLSTQQKSSTNFNQNTHMSNKNKKISSNQPISKTSIINQKNQLQRKFWQINTRISMYEPKKQNFYHSKLPNNNNN